ncbi:MAG: M1 family metallopeptidase [Dehalococcoidia bacterium]
MKNKFRLEKYALPKKYEIFIEPDLENEKFAGNEKIQIQIKESTNQIKLNSIGLKIYKPKLIDSNNNEYIPEINFDNKHEIVEFNFDQEIKEGAYELYLEFSGILDNSLRGFYMSTYQDPKGKLHKIGTTQFESTDARRAFPCFDEPEFKSIFSIKLKVPKDLFTVSNSSLKNTINEDNKLIYEFNDTIKMSTYLVAFIMGPFEETDELIVDGTPLRIVFPEGKKDLSKFALDVGEFALKYFTDYFGRPYPGDKLDMIAIPDFASGAMENLGCITYREALLLVDEKNATQGELTRIADVICHEIAHMWFGDLVTMKWWNGIWLNEAFATFMATKAVDVFNKDWKRWVQFGIERSAAFDVDSLHSTRPIEFEVISPDDASAMFDLLTYEKGGAVLRMLEQYVGEDQFRDGIRSYLKKHEFSNTETSDLWDSIEEFSSIPVRDTMNTWILQPGFPRLKFKDNNGYLELSQETFKYDNINNDFNWKVPIEISSDGKKNKILLEGNKLSTDILIDKFIYGNSNSNGFYRSEYSEDILVNQIFNNLSNLNELEKFSLVDDLWSSVTSNNNDINLFYELCMKLNLDNSTDLQSLIISTFSIGKRYSNDNNKEKMISIVSTYLKKLLENVGNIQNQNENVQITELRALIFRGLGITCEDEEFIQKAKNIYQDYIDGKPDVEPNLAASAIAIMANNGDKQLHEQFLDKYTNSQIPQEKIRFLYSLSEFKSNDLANKTLEMAISKKIKNQDAPYLIATTLRNFRHSLTTWNFIEENWKKINEIFPNNTIPRMFGGIKSISDNNLANRVNIFFEKNPIPQGQKTIDQNIEKMNINLKFVDNQSKILNNWLGSK